MIEQEAIRQKEIETLQARQLALRAKNKALRAYMSNCKSNIKEFERKIEIEVLAMNKTREQMKKNDDDFIEAGNRLSELTGNKVAAE